MFTDTYDLIDSLVDDHIAKFPEKRWLFNDYRTETYDGCMSFLHDYYHQYDPVVKRLVCEIVARRFNLTNEEVIERSESADPLDAYEDLMEEVTNV